MKYVTIATFLSPMDARNARAYLDTRGIEAILMDDHDDEVKILVRSSLAARAMALLNRPTGKLSLVCPRCGSSAIHAASSSVFLPKRWHCDCGYHWRKWNW